MDRPRWRSPTGLHWLVPSKEAHNLAQFERDAIMATTSTPMKTHEDNFRNKAQEMGDAAKQFGDKAKDAAASAADKAKETASNVVDRVKDMASNMADKTKD